MRDDAPDVAFEAIEVLGLAGVSRGLLSAVTSSLSRRVAVPCRERRPPASIESPHIVGRNQVDADGLLERIESLERPEGLLRLALTAEDIGHPVFTHFFGRARHFGDAALVSTARLDPAFYGLPSDPDQTVKRAVLEGLHEIGHLLGLRHCSDWACIMRFASNVEAIDNRGDVFCAVCGENLPTAMRPSLAV